MYSNRESLFQRNPNMTRISKMYSGCFAAHDTSVSHAAEEFRKPKRRTKAYLDPDGRSVSNPSRRWSVKKARHGPVLGHQVSQVATRQCSQKQMLEAGRAAWGEAPLCCQPHFPSVPKCFPGTLLDCLLPPVCEFPNSVLTEGLSLAADSPAPSRGLSQHWLRWRLALQVSPLCSLPGTHTPGF